VEPKLVMVEASLSVRVPLPAKNQGAAGATRALVQRVLS
jgi:hypothetical protein